MEKRSLLLNGDWDIGLSPTGNIATTDGTYCDAQNVANKIRLFTRDAFIAQDKGVPHFMLDLGRMPAVSAVRSSYRKAARSVENIADANVEITGMGGERRSLTGVITATTEAGEKVTIEI